MKITITIEAGNIDEAKEIMQKLSSLGSAKFKLKEYKHPHRKNKPWSDFEIKYIVDNYKSKSIPWIAGKLGRKPQDIYNQLTKLYKNGLVKKANRASKPIKVANKLN